MNDRKRMNLEIDCNIDRERLINENENLRRQIYEYESSGEQSTDERVKYTTEKIITDNLVVTDINPNYTLKCRECKVSSGRVDVIIEDEYGNDIPIEVKLGTAGDSAIGQILGYMFDLNATYGIIVARKFTKRLINIHKLYNIYLYIYEKSENNNIFLDDYE